MATIDTATTLPRLDPDRGGDRAFAQGVDAETARLLGAKLAGFADQAEAALIAAGRVPAERCASCAFRAGTFPNTKAPATGMDALKCLIERHPFGCHHGKSGGLPTRLCGGFVNILAAETGPTLRAAPWPFSDEADSSATDTTGHSS